jgi:hypothetical protein
MNSLTEMHTALTEKDAEYSAEELEMIKQAGEQNAAGRFTARGFADELEKLAAGFGGFAQQAKEKAEGAGRKVVETAKKHPVAAGAAAAAIPASLAARAILRRMHGPAR